MLTEKAPPPPPLRAAVDFVRKRVLQKPFFLSLSRLMSTAWMSSPRIHAPLKSHECALSVSDVWERLNSATEPGWFQSSAGFGGQGRHGHGHKYKNNGETPSIPRQQASSQGVRGVGEGARIAGCTS